MEKSIILVLTVLALMMCPVNCFADEPIDKDSAPVVSDTLRFYDTWEQMIKNKPAATLTSPDVEIYSLYEIYVWTDNDSASDMINRQHIAFSIGDSIWMLNSEYLKNNFKGDFMYFEKYIPVFFTDKAAFVNVMAPVTVKDLISGGDGGEGTFTSAYYFIDFTNRKVERVTHSYMSALLKDYHDLQMRYEGMKDYKKPYMIEEYLFQYINRASQDVMLPTIVDLMCSLPTKQKE